MSDKVEYISFYAQVSFIQKIEIVQEGLTVSEITEGLNSGKYLTTIEYDSEKPEDRTIVEFDDQGNEVVLANILSQKTETDCVEYSDFVEFGTKPPVSSIKVTTF